MLERWVRRTTPASDESIDAFARAGGQAQEVADIFADALVTGIYAGDPRLLSLPACFSAAWPNSSKSMAACSRVSPSSAATPPQGASEG